MKRRFLVFHVSKGKEVFLLAQPAAGNKASTEKGNTTHCSHLPQTGSGWEGHKILAQLEPNTSDHKVDLGLNAESSHENAQSTGIDTSWKKETLTEQTIKSTSLCLVVFDFQLFEICEDPQHL